jgi:hypothetical protein
MLHGTLKPTRTSFGVPGIPEGSVVVGDGTAEVVGVGTTDVDVGGDVFGGVD